jgi:hypothetical protein
VTYGCEAWTLTNRYEQHLRIFESKILRKIFGPVQDKDGSWRIRMNHELSELIGNADIVRFIKSRRIASMNVGSCHHGMERPQVADGGTASDMEGSYE